MAAPHITNVTGFAFVQREEAPLVFQWSPSAMQWIILSKTQTKGKLQECAAAATTKEDKNKRQSGHTWKDKCKRFDFSFDPADHAHCYYKCEWILQREVHMLFANIKSDPIKGTLHVYLNKGI